MILTHKGALTRVEEFLSDEGKEFAPKSGVPFHGLKNEIQLQDIELQHSKDLKAALKHLTVSIPKGATVAFVGASGAGKSTLLDVLLGLYAPTKGEIKVDGFNLKSFTTGSWRDRLGVVSQDSSVFNDTIEENILFGLENKSKEEIVEAAELAGLREFIETLPDKYDTIVGERGYRLSGGQRQRLALARALIRQPEILILDEATSNLDSHSEFLIQTALEKLHSKQTILIVAHRLSTIVHADRIYLLHEGSIAEEGTHTELLEKMDPTRNFGNGKCTTKSSSHENCSHS
jgi:subfamily B ATP-binding cassette protein MsbA